MKSARHFSFLAILLLLTACATAARVLYPVNEDAFNARPGDYRLDGEHARVIFAVNHMGFSTFYAHFRTLEGRLHYDASDPGQSNTAIKIQTGSIDTGVAELDASLREKPMFDSARFPEATFTSTEVVETGDKTGTIKGLLTIKDVTRPVSLSVTFGGSGTHPLTGKKVIGFNASGAFNRSEFGLKRWLPFVGDRIDLTISAEFIRD